MTSIIKAYKNIFTLFLEYFIRDSKSLDPISINKANFYSRALSIAFWYINLPTISIQEVGIAIKNRFGETNLLSHLIETSPKELLELFNNVEKPIRQDAIDVIYEQMLSIENLGFEVKTGKVYRNKLGSYYTPQAYAKEITKLTFKEYLRNHAISALKKVKIVDFSCGCGAFLLAAIQQLKELGIENEELKKTLYNIYGCDVDPLALEIAKISILDFCETPSLYEKLSENFRHSNFLIHTHNEASREDRLQISISGFIYHNKLALGIDFLQHYDIILGNPPWEKIRFEEKKFFSQYIREINLIDFKFSLGQSIAYSMGKNPLVEQFVNTYKHQLEDTKKQIKKNAFFANSSVGELNTCSLFVDSIFQLLQNDGVAGLFVKNSLYTAKINKGLFSKLRCKVIAIYDFINRNKIFDIDSRERFGILLLGNNDRSAIKLGMNLLSLSDINLNVEYIQLSILDVLNPETKMIPNLNSERDMKMLSFLYSSFDIFSKVFSDAKFGRLVHLTNHIKFIEKKANENNLPIIEGKFFSLFDNAYSGFNDVPEVERYKSKATSRKFSEKEKASGKRPISRFFINKDKWADLSKQYNYDYMLAWHSLTSATNLRSCVASLMPFSPGAQSVQFLTLPNNESLIFLTGLFNSIVFDYLVKCKLNGIDLTQTVIAQIPVPSKESAEQLIIKLNGVRKSALEWIIIFVKSFYANDIELSSLFNTVEGDKFTDVLKEDLFIALDLVVAKLYRLSKSQFEYILSLFGKFYSEENQRKIINEYNKLYN